MKKRVVFRIVLIVLCIICTLSVLQVRNVLTNHRQNERDYSTDDSFDEDSPHDLVLPPPPEFEPFELMDKEAKQIQKLEEKQEAKYRTMILYVLQQSFSPNRVRDLNIKIDIKIDNDIMNDLAIHDLLYRYEPYNMYRGWDDKPEIYPPNKFSKRKLDDPKFIHKMDIFNPTQGERNLNIERITVSVNIDGTWKWKYDEKGNPVVLPDGSIAREYTLVPQEQLQATTTLIENAIEYNSARGDLVTVYNIPFDRTAEHKAEDAAYFRKKQMQMTVMIILSGLTLLLIFDIITDLFHDFPWNRRTRRGDKTQIFFSI